MTNRAVNEWAKVVRTGRLASKSRRPQWRKLVFEYQGVDFSKFGVITYKVNFSECVFNDFGHRKTTNKKGVCHADGGHLRPAKKTG